MDMLKNLVGGGIPGLGGGGGGGLGDIGGLLQGLGGGKPGGGGKKAKKKAKKQKMKQMMQQMQQQMAQMQQQMAQMQAGQRPGMGQSPLGQCRGCNPLAAMTNPLGQMGQSPLGGNPLGALASSNLNPAFGGNANQAAANSFALGAGLGMGLAAGARGQSPLANQGAVPGAGLQNFAGNLNSFNTVGQVGPGSLAVAGVSGNGAFAIAGAGNIRTMLG